MLPTWPGGAHGGGAATPPSPGRAGSCCGLPTRRGSCSRSCARGSRTSLPDRGRRAGAPLRRPPARPVVDWSPAGRRRSRDTQRLCEMALWKIVEATAEERIHRALHTKASYPGEMLDCRPGELVEFYRPPRQKDIAGWLGPATVAESFPERGHCKVKWQNQDVLVRFPDLRRYHESSAMVYGVLNQSTTEVERYISRMPANTYKTGWCRAARDGC